MPLSVTRQSSEPYITCHMKPVGTGAHGDGGGGDGIGGGGGGGAGIATGMGVPQMVKPLMPFEE